MPLTLRVEIVTNSNEAAMHTKTKSPIKPILYGLFLCLLAVLLWQQRESMAQAIHTAASADVHWLVVGFLAMMLSVVCTSIVYMLLAPRKLVFIDTLLVQTSSLCVNKVLPAGSGALGVSYLFLRASKIDKLSAGLVVLLNNLLGFAGHAMLLLLILVAFHGGMTWPKMSMPNFVSLPVWWLMGVAIAVLLVLATWWLRRYAAQRVTNKTRKKLRALISRPSRLLIAVGVSMILTLCYVASLYAAGAATGLQLSLPTALLVLTLSVVATVVIPAPGGIGAAEAGAYVALRAFAVDPAQALATAVLYRVISFWFPLLFGTIALIVVEKRHLLAHHA
jgi:uncharacterized membrane protein YbhN (UPF0104 family)